MPKAILQLIAIYLSGDFDRFCDFTIKQDRRRLYLAVWTVVPKSADKLTPRDLRALTPLIWEHVNPYGRFELDMDARLPLV